MTELGFALRGWFAAFWTWFLEPTEDARARAERRRKRDRLRDATKELKRRSRYG